MEGCKWYSNFPPRVIYTSWVWFTYYKVCSHWIRNFPLSRWFLLVLGLSRIGWSFPSLCVPLVGLLVFHLGLLQIGLLVGGLGFPPIGFLGAKLGLALIELLGHGLWLLGECGRWSCGWGLGWYKVDGKSPNLDSWGSGVCGECVDCFCNEIRNACD